MVFLTSKYVLPIASVVAIGAFIIKKCLQDKQNNIIYEVMFFSEQGIVCRSHLKKELTNNSCDFVNCSNRNMRLVYKLIFR